MSKDYLKECDIGKFLLSVGLVMMSFMKFLVCSCAFFDSVVFCHSAILSFYHSVILSFSFWHFFILFISILCHHS